MRTTEGEDDAALANLAEGDGVEAGIALEGIAQGIAVLGKGGRVEDDEVVVAACLFQELEGVLGIGFVARVAREIEFGIGACQFDGLLAAIH